MTWYPTTGPLPVDVGGVQRTVAVIAPPAAPGVTPLMTGRDVDRIATGVTWFEDAEDAPTPTPLIAATWKVYGVPAVSPATRMLVTVGDAGRGAADLDVGGVQYPDPVAGDRASRRCCAGAVQRTVADAPPAAAVPMVGAPGRLPTAAAWLAAPGRPGGSRSTAPSWHRCCCPPSGSTSSSEPAVGVRPAGAAVGERVGGRAVGAAAGSAVPGRAEVAGEDAADEDEPP